MLNNPDKEWEKFGKDDPYFSILNDERYHEGNYDRDLLDEFFLSGENHVSNLLKQIKTISGESYTYGRALDYGCGVGRVLIPLSKFYEEVTGVDVSPSMLKETRKSCEERKIGNTRLVLADDKLSGLSGKYDLIHSHLVFQHIPVKKGEKTLKKLIEHLGIGGVGVVHFTYETNNYYKKGWNKLKKIVPFAHSVNNIIQGRPFNYPQMQINLYDLNRIFMILHDAGAANVMVRHTKHSDNLGAILYFRLA